MAEPSSSTVEVRAMRKVQRRFVPLLVICFIVGFMDRVNVGFAALTMSKQLGFTATAFGLGAGLFFVTYFLCEIPSNLALERFGARRWIARIMITWGVLSALTAFVWNDWSFYGIRILLGAAEAGFFPGIVLFFTYWMPNKYRARVTAMFMAAMPLASVIGSPISGYLIGQEAFGLHGWQLMYLLEGVPSVILAFVVLKVLRDSPADAEWLAPDERAWLQGTLRQEQKDRPHIALAKMVDLFRNRRLLLLAAAYFGMVGMNFCLSFFLPQIVKEFHLSFVQTGFVSALPFLAATIGMTLWGYHSDRTGERRFHVLIPFALAIVSLAGSTLTSVPAVKLLLLCFAAVGVFCSLSIFFAALPNLLSPAMAAVGLAMVNSLGNLSGFTAPYLIGAIKDATGSFNGGLQVLAAYGVVALVILATLLKSEGRIARARPDGLPAQQEA
jgi:ACS family tartrate transporter-like MFS transporter